MARHKSETPYTLTVTDTHGRKLWSFAGSLLRVLDLFSEANEWTAEPIDTYSRIRRELVASGGAYARYFRGYGDGMPVLVEVLAAELLPARQFTQADELPVSGGALAAAAAADAEHRFGSLALPHPDTLSTFGTSPVVEHQRSMAAWVEAPAATPGVPVLLTPDCAEIVCEGCRGTFLAHPAVAPRYCVDCLPVAPAAAPAKRTSADVSAELGDFYRVKFKLRAVDGKWEKYDETRLAHSKEEALRFFTQQYRKQLGSGGFRVLSLTKARIK